MDINKIILFMLTGALTLSLLLVGNGITGMVVFDSTVKGVCSSDNECSSPEVCCIFYQENEGVCNNIEMCGQITEITKKEKEAYGAFLLTTKENQDKIRGNYFAQLLLEVIIIALIVFAISYHIAHFKVVSKKRRRKMAVKK